MQSQSVSMWAQDTFGRAQLNDVRRGRRLVAMAAAAARRPSGKVAAEFDRDEERAGAYDFLENAAIKADALASVLYDATASRARAGETVYVIVDGTALTLTDRVGSRGLGPVGSPNRAARGLQVMNAFAVASDGVPLGLIDQIYWTRDEVELMPKNKRTRRNQKRPFEEKECANFVRTARSAVDRLAKSKARVCVVIDREADNVEDAQLQSVEALRKWATILAAVATRIERLKYLSRNQPESPAELELSADEIEVLKRDQASRGVKKKRVVPASPTLADVTRWIAELGGWIDQKGNGPPGATTIGRGLERLSHMTHALRLRKSARAGPRTIRLGSKGKP